MVMMSLFTLPSAEAWAAELQKRDSCRVCGMYIDNYQKTAAELVTKDGKQEFTCGVACMLREVEDAGGLSAFSSVKVHDWVTGELTDAESATYVIGSKVIPDMVPNYIAFTNRDEAESFVAKEGGKAMTFAMAFEDVSPVGTTAPFRIRTAVTPGKGNFSVGLVYSIVEKDELRVGSNHVDSEAFINSNPAQPKAPGEARTHQEALFFNYSPLDQLALFLNVPFMERMANTFVRNPDTGQVSGKDDHANGFGDIALEGRYNVWRSTCWDKFVTLLIGTSIPTGDFDSARALDAVSGRQLVVKPPSLQLGKGVPTFRGGLLYSQRWKKVWFHGSFVYDINPENFSDFSFGDVGTLGVALHYTPNYDVMLGVEMDASYAGKNEDQGFAIGNTGGISSNVAFVLDWRFANAFGGNFKLRGAAGFPMYEDLNFKDAVNPKSGKPIQQVQLGGGFFANVGIQWTFRSAPHY
jgi:nitrous oxide reductase accessory protein NosL